ncbi:DNA-directed RNA polymerase sigma-70 factor [Thalassotalea marina]|uniref:DNA-directed RNA polymerase sigma-70 factor n=2 Tax=Thalassotalea marina TaxID=1673741 RepID=A0A919BQG1_9GAMM|nr:DNA-directed RNA polymerase sigma-70 factor [Thalassotalea marina]
MYNMPESFYQLKLKPHLGMLFKLCRVYCVNESDLDDLMQEVCLQVFLSSKTFKGHAKWSTWMYRVALNVCLTFKRQQKSHELYTDSINNSSNVEQSAESLELLYMGIRKLKPLDRALLLMHLEGFTYEEIAKVLGGNENSLAVRINRLKGKVAQEINKHDH